MKRKFKTLPERRETARRRMESLYWSNPDVYRERAAERRLTRKLKGQCLECSRPALEDNERCERHRKRNRRSHGTKRERRARYRALRRAERRAEREALQAYVPVDEVVNLTRVRILRAAYALDWFSTYEINRELGATDAHVRNTVTQMLRRLANAGALERRECVGDVGLRAQGGKFEYRITVAGRTEVVDVLGGKRRPSFAGRRTRWAA